MQIYELIIIILLGIAALAAIIIIIVRNVKGKGTCSTGECSSCTVTNGCMDNDKDDRCKINARKQ